MRERKTCVNSKPENMWPLVATTEGPVDFLHYIGLVGNSNTGSLSLSFSPEEKTSLDFSLLVHLTF